MPGARVGARAVGGDSVQGPGAVVGADAGLVGVAVGDEGVVPDGMTLPEGTRVPCGATAG
jgi:hypothetical protein